MSARMYPRSRYILHPLRVFLELGFLVRAMAVDERQEALFLVLLHRLLQRRVADGLVAIEVDVANADLRALGHQERQVNQLRPAGHRLDLVGDGRELVALLGQHVAHDALNAANELRIDERVEADLDVLFLQLVVDLGLFHFLRARVVDDLDPLTFLHVVGDVLADHTVRVGHVFHVDPEVVEELRPPQPLEVLEHRLFVVRRPDSLRGTRRSGLDVIEIRLRLDDRLIALRRKCQLDRAHDRCRPGRGHQSRRSGRHRRCLFLWSWGRRSRRLRSGRGGRRRFLCGSLRRSRLSRGRIAGWRLIRRLNVPDRPVLGLGDRARHAQTGPDQARQSEKHDKSHVHERKQACTTRASRPHGRGRSNPTTELTGP